MSLDTPDYRALLDISLAIEKAVLRLDRIAESVRRIEETLTRRSE